MRKKYGYNITKNSIEAILLDKKNGNTFWINAISKEMTALEMIGVF